MRLSIALLPIAILVSFVAAGCGGSSSKDKEVGLLFVQSAPHGAFVSATGTKDDFTLTLRNSAQQVIWFSDRPERHYGHLAVDRFVSAWKQFGFGSDPPNAALTLLRGDDQEDTVIVKLGTPSYDASLKTLTFPAHRVPHATGRLADFEADNDGAVPKRFADVSLFIDDTTSFGPITGCCQYKNGG